MKKIYYATRLDKNGNKLTTSYADQKSCDRYGGAEATKTNTLYSVKFNDETGTAKIKEELGDLVLRSSLQNANYSENLDFSGRYILYGKLRGTWGKTEFSFPDYGTANTLMKALIDRYQALMVVDEGDHRRSVETAIYEDFDVAGEV